MEEKGAESEARDPAPESLERLGDVLRATFPAENHDSLGEDITRSLLHLSREEKTDPMRVRLAEPDESASG